MKTALILIDIQNDYFPGGRMELEGSIAAAAAATRLLAAFRKNGWHRYHIQHISTQPNAPFFQPNTPGVEIYQSVQPQSGEPVIVKHFPNCFRDTELLAQLKANDVSSLLIGGMMSHMCVDATVRAAFDLGFSCVLVHDACATRELAFAGLTVPARQVQASYMAALGAVYAQVKGVDEIMTNISASDAA